MFDDPMCAPSWDYEEAFDDPGYSTTGWRTRRRFKKPPRVQCRYCYSYQVKWGVIGGKEAMLNKGTTDRHTCQAYYDITKKLRPIDATHFDVIRETTPVKTTTVSIPEDDEDPWAQEPVPPAPTGSEDDMVALLLECAAMFDRYEQIHLEKEDLAKAHANGSMAKKIYMLLARRQASVKKPARATSASQMLAQRATTG